MKKALYALTILYFLSNFFCLGFIQAQTLPPSFVKGWYHILNGNKTLEVVADGENYSVQLAKKSNSSKQLWKLVYIGDDNSSYAYYHITNQWLGEKKTLTVFETSEGILLRMVDTYEQDKNYNQTWVIMYADEKLRGKAGYLLLCITPMSHLTYKKGKFSLEFQDPPQPNQIWRFSLVK
ncbi:MAG: hypothetical protein MUC49_05745 [Raineya sp.]|jgi:hypothetical protein|nr:hypothetical protein [Raineya sp.]